MANITIMNNTNLYTLTLRLVANFRKGLSQVATALEYTEASPINSIQMRMIGQGMTISFSSELFDSATDLSNEHNILTALEQEQFLVGIGGDTANAIFSPGMLTDWTFITQTGESFTVVIQNIDIAESDKNPGWKTATFEMRVGKAQTA